MAVWIWGELPFLDMMTAYLVSSQTARTVNISNNEGLSDDQDEFVHGTVFKEVDSSISVLVEYLNHLDGADDTDGSVFELQVLQLVGLNGATTVTVDAIEPQSQGLDFVGGQHVVVVRQLKH